MKISSISLFMIILAFGASSCASSGSAKNVRTTASDEAIGFEESALVCTTREISGKHSVIDNVGDQHAWLSTIGGNAYAAFESFEVSGKNGPRRLVINGGSPRIFVEVARGAITSMKAYVSSPDLKSETLHQQYNSYVEKIDRGRGQSKAILLPPAKDGKIYDFYCWLSSHDLRKEEKSREGLIAQ